MTEKKYRGTNAGYWTNGYHEVITEKNEDGTIWATCLYVHSGRIVYDGPVWGVEDLDKAAIGFAKWANIA